MKENVSGCFFSEHSVFLHFYLNCCKNAKIYNSNSTSRNPCFLFIVKLRWFLVLVQDCTNRTSLTNTCPVISLVQHTNLPTHQFHIDSQQSFHYIYKVNVVYYTLLTQKTCHFTVLQFSVLTLVLPCVLSLPWFALCSIGKKITPEIIFPESFSPICRIIYARISWCI